MRNLLIAAITSSSLLLSSAHAASPTPKASPSAKATPAVSKSANATPSVSSTTKKSTKKPVKKKRGWTPYRCALALMPKSLLHRNTPARLVLI